MLTPPGRSEGSVGAHPQEGIANPQPGGVQALIPRQPALVPPRQEGVQAVEVLISRKALLTLSPGGVQALIPRQAVLTPTS